MFNCLWVGMTPNVIIIEDMKLYYNREELPPFPMPIDPHAINPLVDWNKIFVDGYELKDGKWKKTLRARIYDYLNF